MSTRPILVTGAGGQVGSELVRAGSRVGDSAVVGLSRADLDVSDHRAVRGALDRLRPAVVVNCAAYTDVDGAEDNVAMARAANALGPGYLAKECAERDVAMIHVSTDYVFDGRAGRAYTEADEPAPVNLYGQTKLEGEEAVRGALDRHLIVRPSWVFSALPGNFVTMMLRLARELPEIRAVIDQRGSPTPARELARVLGDLAHRIASGDDLPWGTYHVAGEPPATRYELALEVVASARRHGSVACEAVTPVPSSAFPTRAVRPTDTSLDCSQARARLGLEPISWLPELDRVARSA